MNDPVCQSLDAFLDDELDHELDSVDSDAFREHLPDCEVCSLLIKQQSIIDNSLRSYAECLVPLDRKQPRLPNELARSLSEPRRSNAKRYAFGLLEAVAVAAIGFGIWFALDQMADEQQVAQQPVDTPSETNAEGKAQVPDAKEDGELSQHLNLEEKLSVLRDELRREQILLQKVEAIAKRAKRPVVALNIIALLEGRRIDRNEKNLDFEGALAGLKIERAKLAESLGEDHPQIKRLDRTLKLTQREFERFTKATVDPAPDTEEIDIGKQLVPLMVERNKFAAKYGDNHPTVKTLDAELDLMKVELKRIIEEEAQRMLAQRTEIKKHLEDWVLIPLLVEREKRCTDLGEQHPTVKSLDLLVKGTKDWIVRQTQQTGNYRQVNDRLHRELRKQVETLGASHPTSIKIVSEVTNLRFALNQQNDPAAAEMIAEIIYAHRADVSLLEKQVSLIESEIAKAKVEASAKIE